MQRLLAKKVDFFLSLHLAFQDWTEGKSSHASPPCAQSEETQMTGNKKLGGFCFETQGLNYVCQAGLQLCLPASDSSLVLGLQACTSMPSPTVDVWINSGWLCLFAFHFLVPRKPFGPDIGVKKSGKINFRTVEYGKLHSDPPNARSFSVARLEWSLPIITEFMPPWKLCSVDHLWKDGCYILWCVCV